MNKYKLPSKNTDEGSFFMIRRIGGHTIGFEEMPSIIGFASVAGKLESEGPLGKGFDKIIYDSYDGKNTYEQAGTHHFQLQRNLPTNGKYIVQQQIQTVSKQHTGKHFQGDKQS